MLDQPARSRRASRLGGGFGATDATGADGRVSGGELCLAA